MVAQTLKMNETRQPLFVKKKKRGTMKKIKKSTKNITNIQVLQKINKYGSLKNSASIDSFEG